MVYTMPALDRDDVELLVEDHPELGPEPILELKDGDVAREVYAPFRTWITTTVPGAHVAESLDALVEDALQHPGQAALIGLATFAGYTWEVYAEPFHCTRHDRIELDYIGHMAHEHPVLVIDDAPSLSLVDAG